MRPFLQDHLKAKLSTVSDYEKPALAQQVIVNNPPLKVAFWVICHLLLIFKDTVQPPK